MGVVLYFMYVSSMVLNCFVFCNFGVLLCAALYMYNDVFSCVALCKYSAVPSCVVLFNYSTILIYVAVYICTCGALFSCITL